ncbi:MAG: glycosyltransferase [Bacteroidetes Order II. Incertae sedis bacterium]|nr:glycosyltransferase [Bacteroidetes Order II. bacterium]
MHILQTIAGLNINNGGTSRTVPYLCEVLTEQGAKVSLLTIGSPDEVLSLPDEHKVNVRVVRPKTYADKRFQMAREFEVHLEHLIQTQRPDVIHDHGVWLWSNWLVSKIAHKHNIPLVNSPNGMLMPASLAHKSLLKRMSWMFYQRPVTQRASALHVTSEVEGAYLSALGIHKPTWVIPNGIRLPDTMPTKRFIMPRKALFLSRLHPIKGIMLLLDAWQNIRSEGWVLEIAGPDEGGYAAEVLQKVTENNLTATVRVTGPVSDTEKWELLTQADLFVLPSKSENFGIVIGEAMAAGLPVITTTGAPWPVLKTEKMGWWVAPTLPALAGALQEGIGLSPEARSLMGARARQYVTKRFAWDQIASTFLDKYRSLRTCT